MKFDKSRIYTAVNADEVKVGSKGYLADNLASLEPLVVSKSPLCTLARIPGPSYNRRFLDCYGTGFSLFYLVEEPSPEIKEVTAAEWDNRPHFMKVWNDYYEDSYNMLVVHIRSADHSHPVVAVDCPDEGIHCFKHCAEIAATIEVKAEEHYRPYSNADEFIEDYKRRFCPDFKGISAIWVKNAAGTLKQVVSITDEGGKVDGRIDYLSFLDTYTYPDGSPCGMEE